MKFIRRPFFLKQKQKRRKSFYHLLSLSKTKRSVSHQNLCLRFVYEAVPCRPYWLSGVECVTLLHNLLILQWPKRYAASAQQIKSNQGKFLIFGKRPYSFGKWKTDGGITRVFLTRKARSRSREILLQHKRRTHIAYYPQILAPALASKTSTMSTLWLQWLASVFR